MNIQPPDSPTTSHPRQSLGWAGFKWIAGTVGVLVGIAVVGWATFNYVANRALEAEISKLRATGQPLSFAEWEKAQPTVAESEDAAPFYKDALALRQPSTDEQVENLMGRLRPVSTQPATAPATQCTSEGEECQPACTQPATASAPSADEVEQVLAANALALEKVDLGSQEPQCAFDLGLTQGLFIAESNYFSSSKHLARLLWLRTVWLARQGRTPEAANSLVSSLRILRMFDHQPTLVACLVKVACLALHIDTVPDVLEAGDLSDQELAEIESALAHADPTNGLARVCVFERVCTLEMFRDPIDLSRWLQPDDVRRVPESIPADKLASPVTRLMAADMLRVNDRCAEAARKGWPEALDAMRDETPSKLNIFACPLGPSYETAFVLFARTIGTVRSAQVAVMVERYRLAKGRLPESLHELRDFAGHDLPADPFTGKDLVYKVKGKGFAVYSVGDDKTDDGGSFQYPDRKDWGLAVRWETQK